MKNIFYILLTFTLFYSSCTKTDQSVSTFDQFDAYFSEKTLQDTIHNLNVEWSYEDSTNIIPDSIFFTVMDTSKLTNKNWDERQLALFKCTMTDNITAYFTARHFVNHDQSALMLLYDVQKKAFVADYIISEFIGYEGYIYNRDGWIFKDDTEQLIRVMVDNVQEFSPADGTQTDSTAKILYHWNDTTFWQKADNKTLQGFDFSNFNNE